MLLAMRAKPYVLIAAGMTWFVFVVWLAVRNVILRQTAVGILAQAVDKLPPPVASVAFTLFWYALLLGWCIPVILGLRLLVRRPN